jgi:hypothetical protein
MAHEQDAKKARKEEGKKRCVLAFSGGLDTSCILAWLIEKVRLHRGSCTVPARVVPARRGMDTGGRGALPCAHACGS